MSAPPKLESTLSRLGFRGLLLLQVAISFALLLSLATWQASRTARANLISQLRVRGESLAQDLVTSAARVGPEAALKDHRTSAGIAYIYLIGRDLRVTAHTFQTLPENLEELNRLPSGSSEPQAVEVEIASQGPSGGALRALDVAVPGGMGPIASGHVGLTLDAVDSQISNLRSRTASTALLASALLLLILALSLTGMLAPLRHLAEVSRHIGKGDLRKSAQVGGVGEVSQIASTMTILVEKLRVVPIELKGSAEILGASVEALLAATTRQGGTLDRQSAALQETQVTAQQIKQTSLVAAQKAESVLQVAEHADELGRSGETAIEESLSGLTEIRAQVEEMSSKINQLNERTLQIGSITQTVKSLADQSNMLALNAAIEAVRSGEHGKGFAVVAREIRSLADQSIESTNRVREILDDISAAIRQAVEITERGAQKIEGGLVQVRATGDTLRQLSGIVKDNSTAVRQIAASVSQQNAGIGQIFTAVNDLSRMMDESVEGLNKTDDAATQLEQVSREVSRIAQQFQVDPK